MKRKKTKKLSFNKLTIAALNKGAMVNMKGGDSNGQPSCNTCETVCASDCRSCTQDTVCTWYICP